MDINKAIALLDEQEFDASLEILNQLVRKKDHQLRAYYWRASLHLKLNNLENALDDINQAIHLYDEYADAYSQRGVIYFHMGMLHLSLKDMNKALALEPQNPYRYSSRAYILGHMKQTEMAINDYRKAIELDPEDAVAHNNLGLLEEQLGFSQTAKKRFEEADRLVVNKDGELVEEHSRETRIDTNEIIQPVLNDETSNGFLATLKMVLTSKEGMRAYWKYLRGIFKSKS